MLVTENMTYDDMYGNISFESKVIIISAFNLWRKINIILRIISNVWVEWGYTRNEDT